MTRNPVFIRIAVLKLSQNTKERQRHGCTYQFHESAELEISWQIYKLVNFVTVLIRLCSSRVFGEKSFVLGDEFSERQPKPIRGVSRIYSKVSPDNRCSLLYIRGAIGKNRTTVSRSPHRNQPQHTATSSNPKDPIYERIRLYGK